MESLKVTQAVMEMALELIRANKRNLLTRRTLKAREVPQEMLPLMQPRRLKILKMPQKISLLKNLRQKLQTVRHKIRANLQTQRPRKRKRRLIQRLQQRMRRRLTRRPL